MIKTTRITTKVHDTISLQVSMMAVANAADLSMAGVALGNPLYGGYLGFLMLEIAAYMHQVGIQQPTTAELIIATDDDVPNRILGFLLYQLVNGRSGEACVNYTAVDKKIRRRGVMTAMFKEMMEHHPVSNLSCRISLVPAYERLGYRVDGHKESHATMCIGQPSRGPVTVFAGEVSGHPLIEKAKQEALRNFGPQRIQLELQRHAFKMEIEKRRAASFATERIESYKT